MGSDDIYRRRAEPVLVLLSDSYSDDKISVSDSRFSSCPISQNELLTYL